MVGVRFSYLGSLFYVELVPRDLFPYLVLYTRFRVEIKKNSSYRHLDLVYCVPSLVFGIHDTYEEALTPGASAENAILDIFEIFSLGQIILVYSKKAFAWQQAILSTSTTFYQIYAWS